MLDPFTSEKHKGKALSSTKLVREKWQKERLALATAHKTLRDVEYNKTNPPTLSVLSLELVRRRFPLPGAKRTDVTYNPTQPKQRPRRERRKRTRGGGDKRICRVRR